MKKLVAGMLLATLAISPALANCGNDNGNGNGCSGEGTGPQGPAGPQGPQGATGANGSNGAQGGAGVNATETPKRNLRGELDVRLLDGKHTSLYVFNSYGFDDSPTHDALMDGRNQEYGFKFVVKLGQSYEESLIEKQAKEIRALETMVSRLSQ